MPSRACVSAGACVTSIPAKRMLPAFGTRSPATQLKKVDFPAPLGPMRPTISPSSTARSASDTAVKPAKRFVTFSALSSMARRRRASGARKGEAAPKLEQSARLEAGDEHDDAAIDDEGEAAATAAEPGVRGGLERYQDDGAQKRAEQCARAAERGDDDHLHRDENAETALGVDETGLECIKRARERGEGGAQHQRIKLVAAHRHAEALRRALAGADGAQVIAEPALLHAPGDEE